MWRFLWYSVVTETYNQILHVPKPQLVDGVLAVHAIVCSIVSVGIEVVNLRFHFRQWRVDFRFMVVRVLLWLLRFGLLRLVMPVNLLIVWFGACSFLPLDSASNHASSPGLTFLCPS